METQLSEFRSAGLVAHTYDVFRLLGEDLPGWWAPGLPEGDEMGPQLAAMQRMIHLAEDREEASRRFSELVETRSSSSMPTRSDARCGCSTSLKMVNRTNPARTIEAFAPEATRTRLPAAGGSERGLREWCCASRARAETCSAAGE
jgi:hypothetical protein